MKASVPYGKTELFFDVPDDNFIGVLDGQSLPPLPDLPGSIVESLRHPIGCAPLAEEVRGKQRVCIVVTDITRTNCYLTLMPLLVAELEAGGITREQITILVATGLHRPNEGDELRQLLGDDIASTVRIVNHRADQKSDVAYLGQTSLGCPIYVNRELVQADYVIATGVLDPHFYAGFSAGRKAIGIGCAGEDTIRFLHAPQVFEDPATKLGNIAGNKFHASLTEIADAAGLRFIVNYIMDEHKQVCAVMSGDHRAAFAAGVDIAKSIYQVEIDQQADIVVAGVSYPKSTNLYQGTRAASNVAFSPYPAVKNGGLVITPCPAEEGAGEGVGERRFRALLSSAESIPDFVDDCRKNGYPGGAQRAYLLALTLMHAEVMMTGLVDETPARELKLSCAKTIEDALRYGLSKFGPDAKICVIPDGVRVFSVRK